MRVALYVYSLLVTMVWALMCTMLQGVHLFCQRAIGCQNAWRMHFGPV